MPCLIVMAMAMAMRGVGATYQAVSCTEGVEGTKTNRRQGKHRGRETRARTGGTESAPRDGKGEGGEGSGVTRALLVSHFTCSLESHPLYKYLGRRSTLRMSHAYKQTLIMQSGSTLG